MRNDALQLLDAGASSSLSDAPETAARVFVFDGRVNSTRSARIEAVPEGSSIATIRDSDSRSVHVWLDDLKPDTACKKKIVSNENVFTFVVCCQMLCMRLMPKMMKFNQW